jgi:chromosome segregation ATPase
VIDKAMATAPGQRYASAAALANELQDFLSNRPTTLDRSRMLRVALWSYRNPQLALTILVAVGLTGLAAGTHVTVARLQDERAALDHKVKAQKAEKEQLNASVGEARDQLEQTHIKLASERENLAILEKSLADERSSYQTLIDAKEQALLDATRSTRKIMEQLETARRDRRSADQRFVILEKTVADQRRETDKVVKERDASRAERDAAQRERDAAVAERDTLARELQNLKAEVDRISAARAARR